MVAWAEEEGQSGAIVVDCDDLNEARQFCICSLTLGFNEGTQWSTYYESPAHDVMPYIAKLPAVIFSTSISTSISRCFHSIPCWDGARGTSQRPREAQRFTLPLQEVRETDDVNGYSKNVVSA